MVLANVCRVLQIIVLVTLLLLVSLLCLLWVFGVVIHLVVVGFGQKVWLLLVCLL
jgi:hypothetical protein